MKKLFFSVLMCVLAFSMNARNFVDLGLPSGTKWASSNEDGYYTYLSAKYNFGKSLPNSGQFEELMYNCTWRWTGKGYRVTGPNGNCIYFPFDGHLDCDEDLYRYGVGTFIWTIDGAGANWAYGCYLSEDQRDILEESNCWGGSVRLVQQ